MSAPGSPGEPAERARPAPAPVANRHGLCQTCRHVRLVATARGSTFFLCERSRADPRFPKYPPQPVRACTGFEPAPG